MAKMTIYRRAEPQDGAAISKLLVDLELTRPDLAIFGFWVAEVEGSVVGIAHVEAVADAAFISSVGVAETVQHRGIASGLLHEIARAWNRDLYLYTVIPGFFARLGFEIVMPPAFLPPRGLFGCDACDVNACVCMKRACV